MFKSLIDRYIIKMSKVVVPCFELSLRQHCLNTRHSPVEHSTSSLSHPLYDTHSWFSVMVKYVLSAIFTCFLPGSVTLWVWCPYWFCSAFLHCIVVFFRFLCLFTTVTVEVVFLADTSIELSSLVFASTCILTFLHNL